MTNKNYLISAAFIITATTNYIDNAFCQHCAGSMNKNIKRITEKIDRMFSNDDFFYDHKKPQAAQATVQFCPQQELAVSQEGDYVTVTLPLGKEIKNIDASIKDNQLLIEIPQKNQTIMLGYEKKRNYLKISVGQSAQKKEEKEGSRHEESFFSSMKHGQTLKQAVQFEKAKVKYKDGILSIYLPKVATSKEKKTPKKIEIEFK